MAFFKWNWGEKKVAQASAGLKKAFSEKPKIYSIIRDLRVELQAEVKETHSQDIINALQQLDARLDEIQQKFNANTSKAMNVFEYARHRREFAEECRSALYSYEPTLMAAPGFANKFKAYLNAFMEEYFGIESCFDVTKSTLGLKADFRQRFNAAKQELMPEESDADECSSCFGLIK
ncbi:hypothetical protein OQJ13_13295 [Legionella sp. PATHC035]|uniref:hypothetical protein n=1 Tax=Legionella sp. PATHC035 TaxID=2992040 RepID=UPI002243BFAE|nr:hypothetical protein [Legionella sp. PATHC035]MCW8409949.1 hypothetical protein [Legionella sp. PATHC035]